MSFNVVTVAPGAADVTRHCERVTDVIDDTVDARVYQGIHFPPCGVAGARIGKRTAHWLASHYFHAD